MTIAKPRTPSRIADPKTVALDVLGRLENAWNDADGEAFGSNYAPEASFVNIRGEHIVGRPAIAAGHTGIFTTLYAGSVNRMNLARATEVPAGTSYRSRLTRWTALPVRWPECTEPYRRASSAPRSTELDARRSCPPTTP